MARRRGFSNLRSWVAVCVLASTSACGRPFDIETPRDFVELEDPGGPFAYRATSPEGVVLAVRVVDLEERSTVTFWERAVTLRLRNTLGYALLAARDVKTRHGAQGRQLTFGRDDDGKPLSYVVTLFRAQDRLFLHEVGGDKDAVERYAANIAWHVDTFAPECDCFLAPVLASRTCNRW